MSRWSKVFYTILLMTSLTLNTFQLGQVAILFAYNQILTNAVITFASDANALKAELFKLKHVPL